MRRFTRFSLVAVCVLALAGCDREKTEAATSLLDAFRNGCPSQREWTESALAQTRAMESVLLSLQANDRCKGIAPALGSVQSLGGQIERLRTDPSIVAEKEAEEVKRQLLVEISVAEPGAARDALVAALANAEVSLSEARAASAVTVDQRGNSAMVRGMNQVSGYLMALLSDQANLSSCSRENPMLAVQLGAGLVAVGGSFVNPAVGAAAAIAGQLLTATIDFARREHLDHMLNKVRAIEMEPALACALESMTNSFCEAEDLYSLIDLQAKSYPQQWKPTRFWQGLDLQSRKVPRLMNWVSRLASGVTPRDTAGADRQNEAWGKVQMLKAIHRTADGVIATVERTLHSPPPAGGLTSGWQEKTIRAGLKKLLETMLLSNRGNGMGGGGGPISEYYSTEGALLYRLVGKVLDCNPNGFGGDCKNVDTIPLPDSGFTGISENAQSVFTEVFQQLQAYLHLVIDVDPAGLLRDALQPDAVGQDSPLEVMNELVTFLEDSAAYFGRLNTPEALQLVPLIRNTQELLIKTATAVATAPGDKDGALKVVMQLFDELSLIDGENFLSGRLSRHIRWDLNARIAAGELPRDVEDILRASGRDAARELLGASRGSLDELNQDVNTAQAVSQRNVEQFVSLFGDSFNESLKRLRAAADRAGEPREGAHRPNRMLQARICTLLLAAPSWPQKVDPGLCEDAVLESIYPLEKLSFVELRASVAGKPLDRRFCAYQRFLRRSRLYETRPKGLLAGPKGLLAGPKGLLAGPKGLLAGPKGLLE